MVYVRLMIGLLLGILVVAPKHLLAGYMAGGEISYQCTGNNQFEIELKVYWDCYENQSVNPLPQTRNLRFYTADNSPATQIGQNGQITLTRVQDGTIKDTLRQDEFCFFIPATACVKYGIYRATVHLPFRFGGYLLAAGFSNRKTIITNINRTVPSGPIVTARINHIALAQCLNSSQFCEIDQFYFCINEPLDFDHSVVEPASDSVVYQFFRPYFNTWPDPPFNPVRFEDGFGLTNLMGSTDHLQIDRQTGRITGTPERSGAFLIGVSATEYTGGQVSSIIYRDFFMYVGDCGKANADFEVDEFYCNRRILRFADKEINENFLSSFWIVGDFDNPIMTFNSDRPQMAFPSFGEFSVTRIAFGPNEACNDTVTKTIVLKGDEVGLSTEVIWGDCTGDSIQFTIIGSSELIPLNELDFELGYFYGSESVFVNDSIITGTVANRYSIIPVIRVLNEDICAPFTWEHIQSGFVYNSGHEGEFFLCEGSVVLDGHYDDRNDNHFFDWNPKDGILSDPLSVQTPTVSPDTTTTYVGTALLENCSGEFTYHIGVYKPGTPFFPDTICGRSFQVVHNPFYGFASRSVWRIYQGGIQVGSSIDDFPLINFPNYGNARIELAPFQLDGIGCPDSISQEVFIFQPRVDWEVELILLECKDSLQLLISGTADGVYIGNEEYLFIFEDHDTLRNNIPEFELHIPATDQIDFTLVFLTDRGCLVEEDFSLPTPYNSLFSGSEQHSVCIGDTLALNYPILDGMEIEWVQNENLISDPENFPVYLLTDSSRTFELLVDYQGCSYSYSYEVEVLFPDQLEPEEMLICDDVLVQQLDFSSWSDGVLSEWKVIDSAGNLIQKGSELRPEITFPDYGRFSLNVSFSSENQCGETAVTNLNLVESGQWDAFLEVLDENCTGSDISLQMTNELSGNVPDESEIRVEWKIIAADTFSYLGDSINLRLEGIGDFKVIMIATDQYGCQSSNSRQFDFELVTIPSDTNLLEVCKGSLLELWPEAPTQYSYAWSPATDLEGALTERNPMARPNQNTLYTARVSSENCSDLYRVFVQVFPLPEILSIFADPETILRGESSFLNVEHEGELWAVEWIPNESLDNPFVLNPVAKPEVSTLYTVFLTSVSGCTDSASVKVEVVDISCGHPYVFVPNAFSPNGDGQNDVLYVRGAGVIEMDLQIYDRYGRRIFHSDSQERGWDGTYRREQLPTGVYAYSLTAVCENGEIYRTSGNVSLVR